MKRTLLLLVCMLTAFAASAQTVNGRNFGIDGFAAYAGTPGTNHYLEGGTTGGAGGEVVKADNFAQLQAYLQSSKPYIVLVDHDITTGIKCYFVPTRAARTVRNRPTASASWWHRTKR